MSDEDEALLQEFADNLQQMLEELPETIGSEIIVGIMEVSKFKFIQGVETNMLMRDMFSALKVEDGELN